jgi:4-hydroxybenzoate polyprenyltransferase
MLGGVVLISASFFMTHVNVITDHELDKAKKPDLFLALSKNMALSQKVMAVELLAAITGIVILASLAYYYAALCLLMFTIISILYSYNFFTWWAPAKYRLKVYWWGHIIVLVVGYLSLWLAGYFLSNNQVHPSVNYWLYLFFIVSVSEYSLFLLESSIDFEEEKAHKLKSMSALIGDKATNIVSLGLGAVSIVLLFWLLHYFTTHEILMLLAFLPPMILRVLFELFVLLNSNFSRREYLKYKFPDILYFGTRLYTLIIIVSALLFT